MNVQTTSSLNNCLTLIRNEFCWHLIWNRVVVPFDTSHPNRGMEDGTKGAAAVLNYQGGQVCNKYRSFFFQSSSKESSGILWQLPLGQGSLMITQPQTNSANLTGLENSQVSKPRRSLEKIGRRSQSIMEKKMIPQIGGSPWSQYWIIGLPWQLPDQPGKVKSINHSGVTVEIQIEAIEKQT